MFAWVTTIRLFYPASIMLIFSFVSVCLAGKSKEDYLVLPEIILPGIDTEIIRQPDVFPDYSLSWLPKLPLYRREYFLDISLPSPEIEVLQPRIELSEHYPEEKEDAVTGLVARREDFSDELLPLELELMFQDSLIVQAALGPFAGHKVTAGTHVEFAEFRFSRLELDWKFSRYMDSRLTFGSKLDNRFYLFGHISGFPGQIKPSFWDVRVQIFQESHFVGVLAFSLDYSLVLGESNWFIRLGGRGSIHGKEDVFSPAGGGHLGLGWDDPFHGVNLSLAAGVDFINEEEVRVSPVMNVDWILSDNWKFFASVETGAVYPGEALNTVRLKTVHNPGKSLPVYTDYAVGVSGRVGTGMNLFSRLRFQEGDILFYDSDHQKITAANDLRIEGEMVLDFNILSGFLKFDGAYEASLRAFPDEWMTEISYSYDKFRFFAAGGSENRLISDVLRDFTGNRLYAGVGFGVKIARSVLSASVYSLLEEGSPGFVIKAGWRFL